MSSDLNSIWLDWRAKVPNGVPNPSNAYHLVLLKELCLKKGIDKDIVDNVMLTLEDVDDEKIKWKDKDGKDKETSLDTIKRYQYDKDFKSNKNKQLAVAAAGLDDKDKSSKEKEEPKDSGMGTDDYADSSLRSNPDAIDVGAEDGREDGKEDDKPKEKGIVAGDANEGDNQVKNDMLKFGYKNFRYIS